MARTPHGFTVCCTFQERRRTWGFYYHLCMNQHCQSLDMLDEPPDFHCARKLWMELLHGREWWMKALNTFCFFLSHVGSSKCKNSTFSGWLPLSQSTHNQLAQPLYGNISFYYLQHQEYMKSQSCVLKEGRAHSPRGDQQPPCMLHLLLPFYCMQAPVEAKIT